MCRLAPRIDVVFEALRKRRPTLAKIIAVLFETLTRELVNFKYAVIGVCGD